MKRFFQSKTMIAVAAAVVVVTIMAALSFAFQGEASPVSNFFGWVTSPFREGAAGIGRTFSNISSYIYDFEDLKAENAALKARIAAMEADVREGEQILEENERLHTLLGLAEKRRDFEYVKTDIVSRGLSNWESTFTINKGTRDGVSANDCVVDETHALVGQVTEVGDNWAVVSTLIDTQARLGATVYRTGDTAVLEGDFSLMGDGKLMLTYLPDDAVVLNGDVILTSGVGDVYPSKLVVGRVDEVRVNAGGTGNYAVVTPEVNLGELRQVFVIVEFDISE